MHKLLLFLGFVTSYSDAWIYTKREHGYGAYQRRTLNNAIYKLQRTLGLRFLYPVYLIDVVEVTLHDQTSDVTMIKSKIGHILVVPHSHDNNLQWICMSQLKHSFRQSWSIHLSVHQETIQGNWQSKRHLICKWEPKPNKITCKLLLVYDLGIRNLFSKHIYYLEADYQRSYRSVWTED